MYSRPAPPSTAKIPGRASATDEAPDGSNAATTERIRRTASNTRESGRSRSIRDSRLAWLRHLARASSHAIRTPRGSCRAASWLRFVTAAPIRAPVTSRPRVFAPVSDDDVGAVLGGQQQRVGGHRDAGAEHDLLDVIDRILLTPPVDRDDQAVAPLAHRGALRVDQQIHSPPPTRSAPHPNAVPLPTPSSCATPSSPAGGPQSSYRQGADDAANRLSTMPGSADGSRLHQRDRHGGARTDEHAYRNRQIPVHGYPAVGEFAQPVPRRPDERRKGRHSEQLLALPQLQWRNRLHDDRALRGHRRKA
jgi:hypothetical protein